MSSLLPSSFLLLPSTKPKYIIQPENFHVIIWRKESNSDSVDLVRQKQCTKSVPSRGTKTEIHTVEIKQRILQYCRVDRSAAEIQALIGLANHTRFKRQWLDPLLDDKLLTYTVPDKPRSRLQKYRLTVKGLELLKGGCA